MPDPKKKTKLETADLDGQEIFATGEYTSAGGVKQKYTAADLNGMADAANEMGDRLSAKVKLGHNSKQELAKLEGIFGKDGIPAFGWMRNFRVAGEKLICDMKQVPAKLAGLIKAGAFKYVSLEIAKNFKDEATGKLYKLLPVGIAILGKEMPALSNLNELAALYGIKTETNDGVPDAEFWYRRDPESTSPNNHAGGENEMDELKKQIAELTAKLAASEAQVKKLEAANAKFADAKEKATAEASKKAATDAKEKATAAAEKHSKISEELEAIKKENGAMKTEIAEYAKAADEAEDKEQDAFLDKHSKKIPPALRSHFKALMKQAASDPEKFSIEVGDETVTDIRKHIEDMPESELFAQHGKQTKAEDRNTTSEAAKEKKYLAHCKEHDLDPNDKDVYANVMIKLDLYDKDETAREV